MTSETDASTFVVATHGHCFDGMCSAALFTRLIRAVGPRGATFSYHACGYGPKGTGVEPSLLTGKDNAILDFRYTATPQLTWYFDHHVTAFATPADRHHFDSTKDAQKFFDPGYGSCTKLIYDVSRDHYRVGDTPGIVELVRWADIIDAARFPSAEMAVRREEPALQLMTVVENEANDAFITRIVPMLLERPLDEIALDPDIQASWKPLALDHQAFIERVRGKTETMGSVVYADLTDELTEVVGKFVTYALFPQSMYSVVVSRGKSRCKISVGYNPWCGRPRRHDISAICSRFGGGGHAVVGAIALATSDVQRAKEIAQGIARELDA